MALASYNWGEGAVGLAIEKNRAQNLSTDYLSLTMPAETKNYVPKLQALKNIFANPAVVAELHLTTIPNRPYFGTVTKATNIDVKVAAMLTEIAERDSQLADQRDHLEDTVQERTQALSLAKEAAEAASRAHCDLVATDVGRCVPDGTGTDHGHLDEPGRDRLERRVARPEGRVRPRDLHRVDHRGRDKLRGHGCPAGAGGPLPGLCRGWAP